MNRLFPLMLLYPGWLSGNQECLEEMDDADSWLGCSHESVCCYVWWVCRGPAVRTKSWTIFQL